MIKLDWIQNYGGTQYIDTGFKPNQDTRIVMRVSEPGNNAWFFSVWSTYQWNSNNYSFINDAASSAGKVFACYGNKTGGGIPVITGENNIDFNKNTLTVNGNVVNTFENNTFQALYNLFLFARSYVGNVQYASAVSDFRLHNCQIYDNDVLVRDFVPALDEDFVICLYDRVTETYFYNKGSGAFKGAFPQSAKTWEIQQETLEQFADEARRLGCVAGKLTTTEMLDIFKKTVSNSGYSFMPVMTGVNAWFDARHEVSATTWGNLNGENNLELLNPTVTANGVELVGSETSYGKLTLPWTSGNSRTAYFVFKNLNGKFANWKSIIGNEDTNGRCATIAMDTSGYIKFTRYDIIPSTSLGYKCSDWHVVAVVTSGNTVKMWIDGDYIGSATSAGWANDTYLCRGYGWAYETNETAFRAIVMADAAHTNAEVAINSGWLYHQFIYDYATAG